MLTLWIVTVIFVGGPYGQVPRPRAGIGVTAGHHQVRTGPGGRASFRVRAGTYNLTVAHCGKLPPVRVRGETTRTRVRCSIR